MSDVAESDVCKCVLRVLTKGLLFTNIDVILKALIYRECSNDNDKNTQL